jgi:hypothetical protein
VIVFKKVDSPHMDSLGWAGPESIPVMHIKTRGRHNKLNRKVQWAEALFGKSPFCVSRRLVQKVLFLLRRVTLMVVRPRIMESLAMRGQTVYPSKG